MFTFFTKALVVALLTGNLGGGDWGGTSPSNSARRMDQLLNVSENIRPTEDWQPRSQGDRPTHVVPIRVHGGIGP